MRHKQLHAKLGVLELGKKEKYVTCAKRSVIKGEIHLTKAQKNEIEKKANSMMRKYNAINNQDKKNIVRNRADNGNVYAYFVRDATKKVLKGSPVKGKVTVLSPKQLLGMMKTPVARKKSYVHEKVVANPIAGKKLLKKIMDKPKKTTKGVKHGIGMGVMGSVQNPFINAHCVKGGDYLYKPTELRVFARIAGVPAAEIEKAKMSRLKLCDLIRKAKAKTPSPKPKTKTPSPKPKTKTPSPKPKSITRIRGILEKQQKRKMPGIFLARYGGLKQRSPPKAASKRRTPSPPKVASKRRTPSPPKVASKRRTPSPRVNNNDENYNDIIPWQLRSPRSHERHARLKNKVYMNHLREDEPMKFLKEIGYDIDRIARKSPKVPDPYRKKNLENIATKLSIMLGEVKYTNTNLRKLIRGMINKK